MRELDTTTTVVIVGAGVGGGRAAEALRSWGYAGRIVMLGAEAERPYERPPLSKGYLLGDGNEAGYFLRPEGYYEEQEIETRFGARAVGLDTGASHVLLDDGEVVPYDRLVIATGAIPRRLAVPGGDLPGTHTLRTLADARAIRAGLDGARRVAIAGAGFIGVELAACCRTLGLDVVVLEMGLWPLDRVWGAEVGQIVARIHREHGVDLRLGEAVVGFEEGADGRVARMRSSGGDVVACDIALVGVGVVPEVGWLAGSGIEIARGVLVDEYCETNVPGVYAVGDVAEWYHPGYDERLLVEHFDNAGNQAGAAARAMLGNPAPYAPIPYFWSDQYDIHFQYAGHIAGYDEVVFRGEVESNSWAAFYLREGDLRAVVVANRFRDFAAARRLLASGVPVTPEQLADEGVELKGLLR